MAIAITNFIECRNRVRERGGILEVQRRDKAKSPTPMECNGDGARPNKKSDCQGQSDCGFIIRYNVNCL